LGEIAVRNVVILLAIGFISALISAWVFELTPAGLKRESQVDRSQSITPQTGKKLDRMIMVVLAAALSYFAFDKFVLTPRREAAMEVQKTAEVEQARQAGRSEALIGSYGDNSIAVLPFLNMSDDASNEFFSDGISEELINLLARITELRVISRSSAFSYKGKDIKLAQVAEELNVSHILEGSVRKAGNRVRITVQLIEARTDTHLWSETYDRTLDDIFTIQDEIAAAVVKQLKITLLGSVPNAEETDPEAYALYLQARHLGRLSTAEGFEQSNHLFERVLAIDPNFAAAWDRLATNYINQAGAGLLPFEEGYTKAREAAEKALAIDPGYAQAHSRLGWIALYHDNDLAQGARHFQRALELDPANTSIIGNAASVLQSLGRVDEAIALEEYFTARDPVDPAGHANLGSSYLSAGLWDAAISSYQTALRLSPDRIGAHYSIGTALLYKGEAQAALAAMHQESFETYRLLGLVMAHHALGDPVASDAALAELIGKYEQEWAYNIACVLAYRDEADRAFAWLDKAVDHGDPGLSDIVVQLEFRNTHADPRWLPFLESIGKSPAQLDAIEFTVAVPK
jgi:TolB-like protein/Tfp pilus assembly protein PilF